MWLPLFSLFVICQASTGSEVVAGKACTGKILSLDPICLGYSLTTCGTVGVYVNITYQDQLLYEEVIRDAREYERCQADAGSTCNSCIKFASITVKPTYAKFCPKVVVTCTVAGLPIKNTQNLDCIELGADCNATTCIDCATTAGCGWCGVKNKCLSNVRAQAYCDTCDKLWYPEDTCPRPLAAQLGMSEGSVVALAVTLPLVFLALAVIGCCICRKRQAAKRSPPVALQDYDSEQYVAGPVMATPAPDTPTNTHT